MENVLVTGGAGYLGSLLVPELLKRGCKVTVYDNFLWGINPLLHVAGSPKLDIIKGDVRDPRALEPHLKKADTVINLAAIVGYPACLANPLDARSINLDAARDICQRMSSSQHIIQASTGSTYGAVPGICDEDTPINPLTIYGETKAEAEKHILDRQGVPLRFATVFGVSPRLRLDLLVNDIVYQVVHFGTFVMYEGGARRTFLHSTDAVRSVLFTMDNYQKMKGRAYNVGDESMNYSKRQVAELVKQKRPYYLHYAEVGEDQDKRDYEVSYERIKALGYKAEVSMGDGIDELLKVLPNVNERSQFRNV